MMHEALKLRLNLVRAVHFPLACHSGDSVCWPFSVWFRWAGCLTRCSAAHSRPPSGRCFSSTSSAAEQSTCSPTSEWQTVNESCKLSFLFFFNLHRIKFDVKNRSKMWMSVFPFFFFSGGCHSCAVIRKVWFWPKSAPLLYTFTFKLPDRFFHIHVVLRSC